MREMNRQSLKRIRKKIDVLAMKINVPNDLLPAYGRPIYDGQYYIKVESGIMFYIFSERGQEISRTTNNIDEFFYWIFADITSIMARHYELQNRIEDRDPRRIAFNRQEALLGQLSEDWGEKKKIEHQNILKSAPFDDLAGLRATFCGQLMKQGYSEAEMEKIAYNKYPGPRHQKVNAYKITKKGDMIVFKNGVPKYKNGMEICPSNPIYLNGKPVAFNEKEDVFDKNETFHYF